MANILRTDTRPLLEAAIQAAAEALRRDEVVALPTETVYGLAANAWRQEAVGKLFQVKGRPAHNPIIVHVASMKMARTCAVDWPAAATRLADAFWPGPLTLVVARSDRIPDAVTAGGGTVGLRWPRHPVAQAVIRACGFPLAAPSANLSGQVSPTKAEHVQRGLGDRIGLIVDGGACEVGIESTVLDLSSAPPRVLRPGMIDAETLRAVIGEVETSVRLDGPSALRSPGLLPKHYAPRAKVLLWDGREAVGLVDNSGPWQVTAQKIHLFTRRVALSVPEFGRIWVMPDEPAGFAKALYAAWHEADDAGAQLLVVEEVPTTAEWAGIADRLRRAAAD